ncbi:hypothetical protein Y695_04393 [Hydrogenophaga sp. T4]|nr:hypothetical protein Y695_04393 [Hydrogenophaga sp. T4]
MTRTSFPGARLLASLRAFFAHSPLTWTRRFAVLSLVCIALSALTSATLLSRHVSERMLWRNAELAQEFLDSLVRMQDGHRLFQQGGEARQFEQLFGEMARMPGWCTPMCLMRSAGWCGPPTPRPSGATPGSTPNWTKRWADGWRWRARCWRLPASSSRNTRSCPMTGAMPSRSTSRSGTRSPTAWSVWPSSTCCPRA